MYPYIDVFRARVVRSTRWTCAATLLPSRSCWSTGTRPLQCQWSSLCLPLSSSARLRPALLLACRGFLSPCAATPPPLPPPATGARTLSAQTTRWRCWSTMKSWLRLAPLLMPRQVKIRICFSSFWLFWHYCLFFESPPGYLEILHILRVRLPPLCLAVRWWEGSGFPRY